MDTGRPYWKLLIGTGSGVIRNKHTLGPNLFPVSDIQTDVVAWTGAKSLFNVPTSLAPSQPGRE